MSSFMISLLPLQMDWMCESTTPCEDTQTRLVTRCNNKKNQRGPLKKKPKTTTHQSALTWQLGTPTCSPSLRGAGDTRWPPCSGDQTPWKKYYKSSGISNTIRSFKRFHIMQTTTTPPLEGDKHTPASPVLGHGGVQAVLSMQLNTGVYEGPAHTDLRLQLRQLVLHLLQGGARLAFLSNRS